MSLFIELYLDEDVDILVAKLLKARGYSASTTLEAGQTGATDTEQFDFAAAKGWALLTHNRWVPLLACPAVLPYAFYIVRTLFAD
jgi:predicted nuclease of predicted toxin-antitoxin system